MTKRRTKIFAHWSKSPVRGLDSTRLAIGGATAISLLANFGLSKLIATRQGVEGMAALGVLLAISSLFVLFGDLNIGPEFVRRLAVRGSYENQDRESQELVGTVFAITFTVSGFLFLVLLLLSPLVARVLDVTTWSITAAGLAGAITSIAQQCFNFLSGRGNGGRMAVVSSLRTLAVFLGVFGAMVILSFSIPSSYLIGQVAGGLVAVVLTFGKFRRLGLIRNFTDVKKLLKSGLSMTGTLMTYGGVLFSLPLLIQSTAGTEVNGLIKAGLLLSGAIMQLINAMLRYEFLPRISACRSHVEAKSSISAEMKLLVPLFGCAALALIVARPIIWPIFLTADFAGAATPLIWIVIGDLQRVFVAIIGHSLFSLDGRKSYLLLESLGGASLLLLVWIMSESSGQTLPVAVGYSLAHTVALIGAALFAKFQIGLDDVPELCLTVVKVGAQILVAVASIYGAGRFGYVLALLVLSLLTRDAVKALHAKRQPT